MRVFVEVLEVSNASKGTPDEIQDLKAWKYFRLLLNFRRVKVLRHDLQRNLTRPFEEPHLIEISWQKIHFSEIFF